VGDMLITLSLVSGPSSRTSRLNRSVDCGFESRRGFNFDRVA